MSLLTIAPERTRLRKPDALTEREHEVYTRFYELTRQNGYQPGLRDLAAEFGWASFNASRQFLVAIQDKGWIEMPQQTKRAVRFLYRPDGKPFRGFADA